MRILNRILPFLLVIFILVALGFGILILAYLFLLGAIIAFVFFIINWIRQTFFPRKKSPKQKKQTGRIIDTDDWKAL